MMMQYDEVQKRQLKLTVRGGRSGLQQWERFDRTPLCKEAYRRLYTDKLWALIWHDWRKNRLHTFCIGFNTATYHAGFCFWESKNDSPNFAEGLLLVVISVKVVIRPTIYLFLF